jgi:hypothetical protein
MLSTNGHQCRWEKRWPVPLTVSGRSWVITSRTSTQLAGTVPWLSVGYYYGLTVSNGDGTSFTIDPTFLYTNTSAPAMTSVFPAPGPIAGGTTATINGTNFANPQVTFGSYPVAITSSTATRLVVVTAPHPNGAVDVVVSAGGGVVAVPGAFTYTAEGLTFTDSPLRPRVTAVKADHVDELRQRITELRTRHGLSAPTWTDPVLAARVTGVKAVHLTELRAALDAVYVATGRTAPTWTPATIVPGTTVVSAAQIEEVRLVLLAIW